MVGKERIHKTAERPVIAKDYVLFRSFTQESFFFFHFLFRLFDSLCVIQFS